MSDALDPAVFKAYDIRGLYGEQLDAAAAHAIGRSFARVIAGLADKTTGELRLGLGRDMRLTAPEMAAAYRDGMTAEGATVLDAGQVGTEMLYFLVGSHDLDGGLMCTASHNPKAYTGAKLVGRGALALSGDSGIGDVRDQIAAGLGDAPGGGSVQEVDIADDFRAAALRFIDPSVIKPLKVVVDGGNGMAGPMVGPLLERLGLDLETAYWTPDGNFPDHEPNPLLPENRAFIMREVVDRGADLGIAWDGDADRCFFIDDTGSFVDGDFLTALLAEAVLRKNPGETILYDVRASRAVRRHRRRGGRHGADQPRRPRLLQDPHAQRGRHLRRRGVRPLLLPRFLLRGLGHAARAAAARAAQHRADDDVGLVGPVSHALLHLRRDQLRGQRRAGQDAGAGRTLRRRGAEPAGWDLDRLRGLALQRALVQHRAVAAPLPGIAAFARGHGGQARRGAGRDPLVTPAGETAEGPELLRTAAEAGIHRIAVPTPFAVGRVNCYLLEGSPLTLVDTGPNSGKSLDELERELNALGHAVEELELIVITHQHIDHLGLTEVLVGRSGADVAALDLLVGYLQRFGSEVGQDDAFSMAIMRRHGVPDDLAIALSTVGAAFRAFGSSARVTRPLHDGGELVIGAAGLRRPPPARSQPLGHAAARDGRPAC